MMARDLLELDDAAFERRIQAVKLRMPQPARPRNDYLPSWYERHAADFVDTIPSQPMPLPRTGGCGACRRECRAPQACRHPEPGDGIQRGVVGALAVALLALAGAVAWWLMR